MKNIGKKITSMQAWENECKIAEQKDYCDNNVVKYNFGI